MIDNNDLITVSCNLNDSMKLFFYETFAFGASVPRYTTQCPYMVMISWKNKVELDVF